MDFYCGLLLSNRAGTAFSFSDGRCGTKSVSGCIDSKLRVCTPPSLLPTVVGAKQTHECHDKCYYRGGTVPFFGGKFSDLTHEALQLRNYAVCRCSVSGIYYLCRTVLLAKHSDHEVSHRVEPTYVSTYFSIY